MNRQHLMIIASAACLVAAGAIVFWWAKPAALPGATEDVQIVCRECGATTGDTFQHVLAEARSQRARSGFNDHWSIRCPKCGKWASVVRKNEAPLGAAAPP